jgi:PAS domain S-box-containing protein
MATDPAVTGRELTAARLRLHQEAVRISTLATAAMALTLAFLVRDSAIAVLGLSGLAGALLLRAAVGWAHAHRTSMATPANWLRIYRLSYAVHGGVWLMIGWQLTAQAGPERHPLLVFILTALTAGALVTAAFDWVAALLFGGLAFAPLALRLLGLGDPVAQAETTVALVFVLVMLLTLRRSEQALRLSVRQQVDVLASADLARGLAADMEAALAKMVDANRDLQIHAWAINSITDAVSVISEDAVYRMVNDTWCRNTGVPREAVIGRSARSLLPSLSSEARVAAMRACLASNRVQVLRGPVELPSMQGRTVQTHLYPYGGPDQARCVVLVSRDVTAEEEALRALQASEAEQRALLDAFPGYIARLDSKLVYRYVNRRMAEVLGTTPQAMIGRTPEALFGAERGALIRDDFNRTQAGDSIITDRCIRPPDGGPEVWVQITTAVGQDPRTGEPQFYAFCTDITGLHRARVAMAEARAEAERANRAKSQFLAQMSHELRTPLNAILGFAELMDTDAQQPLNALQRSHLGEIRRGGEHLLGLINELLELGRIEAGHLAVRAEAVGLRELLAECLNLLQPLAAARPVHLLPLHADASAGQVLADPLRLKQVLLNLLGNAIKYNRPGGVVEVAWAARGRQVQISVRDSGPGLAPADQVRAFEPFERLDAGRTDVEGAGIGLALSRRLVEAMGGEIGIDSDPGVGSTFWLRLPRFGADGAGPAPRSAQPHGGAGVSPAAPPAAAGAAAGGAAPVRVLYIEDNPVNLMLMQAMLERLPEVQARCVISPTEGLALAAAQPPDLILLDLQMPVMDGFEVLRRLRAQPALRDIPVLAVSANALQADINAALAAGFNGYLTKPIQLDGLAAAVRGALRPR